MRTFTYNRDFSRDAWIIAREIGLEALHPTAKTKARAQMQ